MQATEKAAAAAGHSYEQMMENAGRAVAEAVEATYGAIGAKVLVLVGPGHNGGDGLVTARHLAQKGAEVTVYVWKRQVEGDKNWTLLAATNVKTVFGLADSDQQCLKHLLEDATTIVDALLGTGVSRPISGTLAELLQRVKSTVTARRRPQPNSLVEPTQPPKRQKPGPVIVAVDLPSGLNSDTGAVDPYTLAADLTVTFGAAKYGHILPPGPEVVGRLMVDDIGLKPEHYPAEVTLEMVTASKVAALLPKRSAGAHKGTFGTALLVAGSRDYPGAAVLTASAALRSGTGVVTLACAKEIYPILAAHLTETTYLPLPSEAGTVAPEAVPLLREKFSKATALLLGPGLGQVGRVGDFLLALLKEAADLPPLVLDADALNLLAQQPAWWELLPTNCILTPHPGEMARLMDSTSVAVQAARLEVTQEMAAKWQQIVLLKGAHTIIAVPDGRMVVQPFANPALAKAGSGDVLAGAITGLRAQGLAPFEAAVAGAYLHGLAGELARERLGATAVVARDLVKFLPQAIREVSES